MLARKEEKKHNIEHIQHVQETRWRNLPVKVSTNRSGPETRESEKRASEVLQTEPRTENIREVGTGDFEMIGL